MLLLSDNDIIIKLSLLGLFDDFLECLKISKKEIFITPTAQHSIPAQFKKYEKELGEIKYALPKTSDFTIVEDIDSEVLSELQSDNIDSGEAFLSAVLIKNNQYYMATGDKRFLKAIKATSYNECFKNKIFTFELCLSILCKNKGYPYVKGIILSNQEQCVKIDSLFRMAFKPTTCETDDMECLISYSDDIKEFLAEIY